MDATVCTADHGFVGATNLGGDGEPVAVPGVSPGAVDVRRGRAASPTGYRKDGREWRIGTNADVAWIQEATESGLKVTSAIPPVFVAYATIVVPDEGRAETWERALGLLREGSVDQPWWLGYLDTGADDVVFPGAPRIRLYADWPYVLVRAGPGEALRWQNDQWSWRAPGPDLVLPADRSWLLSWLWDDDWRCLGGSTALIDRFLDEPRLEVRRVGIDEDATPPGHVAL
jgi:hypothetical protein